MEELANPGSNLTVATIPLICYKQQTTILAATAKSATRNGALTATTMELN